MLFDFCDCPFVIVPVSIFIHIVAIRSMYRIENHPPPLPASLPPVGGQQIRHSTTAYRTTTTGVGPNNYNNHHYNNNNGQPVATVRTATWHQHYNNGNSALNATMLANNNFLNNERAASSASG